MYPDYIGAKQGSSITSSNTLTPDSSPILQTIVSRLEAVSQCMVCEARTTESFIDRLMGAQPSPVNKSEPRKRPDTFVETMYALLDELERTHDLQRSNNERLSKLIGQ